MIKSKTKHFLKLVAYWLVLKLPNKIVAKHIITKCKNIFRTQTRKIQPRTYFESEIKKNINFTRSTVKLLKQTEISKITEIWQKANPALERSKTKNCYTKSLTKILLKSVHRNEKKNKQVK